MATNLVDPPQGKADQIAGIGRLAIKRNPLTSDEIRMFEMFERGLASRKAWHRHLGPWRVRAENSIFLGQ